MISKNVASLLNQKSGHDRIEMACSSGKCVECLSSNCVWQSGTCLQVCDSSASTVCLKPGDACKESNSTLNVVLAVVIVAVIFLLSLCMITYYLRSKRNRRIPASHYNDRSSDDIDGFQNIDLREKPVSPKRQKSVTFAIVPDIINPDFQSKSDPDENKSGDLSFDDIDIGTSTNVSVTRNYVNGAGTMPLIYTKQDILDTIDSTSSVSTDPDSSIEIPQAMPQSTEEKRRNERYIELAKSEPPLEIEHEKSTVVVIKQYKPKRLGDNVTVLTLELPLDTKISELQTQLCDIVGCRKSHLELVFNDKHFSGEQSDRCMYDIGINFLEQHFIVIKT